MLEAVLIKEGGSVFYLHPPPHLLHVASDRDGSLLKFLKCYDPWEYIQLTTG